MIKNIEILRRAHGVAVFNDPVNYWAIKLTDTGYENSASIFASIGVSLLSEDKIKEDFEL